MNMLSKKLKALREDSDMKQSELAEKLNVGRSTIANYESGKITPSYDILIKYADIFDTTTDYLLGRVDDRNFKITSNSNINVEHDKKTTFNESELKLLEAAMKMLIDKQ